MHYLNLRIHIYSTQRPREGYIVSTKYPESNFSRNARARMTAQVTYRTIVSSIVIGVIVMVVAVAVSFSLGYDKAYSDSTQNNAGSYQQGYNDGVGDMSMASNQPGLIDSGQYDTQSYAPSIQFAIASTSQTVLWGLDDPYNDQIISSSTPLAGTGMPFGIQLSACTVYMVTIDNKGQQAITPVPTTQVPAQFLRYISGCNPASATPWWVTDQFAPQGPSKLPTTGGGSNFNSNQPGSNG